MLSVHFGFDIALSYKTLRTYFLMFYSICQSSCMCARYQGGCVCSVCGGLMCQRSWYTRTEPPWAGVHVAFIRVKIFVPRACRNDVAWVQELGFFVFLTYKCFRKYRKCYSQFFINTWNFFQGRISEQVLRWCRDQICSFLIQTAFIEVHWWRRMITLLHSTTFQIYGELSHHRISLMSNLR